MSGKAELRLFARALAQEAGLRISGALMSLVAALLAVKVRPGFAPAGALRRLVFGPEALEAGPRLDQRDIHAEVLVAQPAAGPCQLHHLGEEDFGRGLAEQARLVLAEAARVEDGAGLVRVDVGNHWKSKS